MELLTLKEADKEARRRILQKRESHQSVYEDLQSQVLEGKTNLVETMEKIPMLGKIAKLNWLRWTYIVLCGLYALLNILSFALIISVGVALPIFVYIVTFITIGAIVFGIFGCIKHNYLFVRSVSIFCIFRIFQTSRALMRDRGATDNSVLIDIACYFLIVILGFILFSVMKTKTERKKVLIDGKRKTIAVFETDKMVHESELIDQ